MDQMQISKSFTPPTWEERTTRETKLRDMILYLANFATEADKEFTPFNDDGSIDAQHGAKCYNYVLSAIAYATGGIVYDGEGCGEEETEELDIDGSHFWNEEDLIYSLCDELNQEAIPELLEMAHNDFLEAAYACGY